MGGALDSGGRTGFWATGTVAPGCCCCGCCVGLPFSDSEASLADSEFCRFAAEEAAVVRDDSFELVSPGACTVDDAMTEPSGRCGTSGVVGTTIGAGLELTDVEDEKEEDAAGAGGCTVVVAAAEGGMT